MAPQATCTRRRSRNDVCERCVSSLRRFVCLRGVRDAQRCACVCLCSCESPVALKACATCKRFHCKRSVKSCTIRRYGAGETKPLTAAASVLHNKHHSSHCKAARRRVARKAARRRVAPKHSSRCPRGRHVAKKWAASCASASTNKERNAATSNLYESGFI